MTGSLPVSELYSTALLNCSEGADHFSRTAALTIVQAVRVTNALILIQYHFLRDLMDV